MEFSESEYCSKFVCTSESSASCNWSKWDNPLNHQFPDGSFQTCVGAQVRCGCTTALHLISYVTYEHPTVVSLSFLLLSTLMLILFIKYIVTQQECDLVCCLCMPISTRAGRFPTPTNSNPAVAANDDFNNYHISASGETGNTDSERNIQIYFIEMDKPPSYSCVMLQEIEKLPPSYVECIKNQGFTKD